MFKTQVQRSTVKQLHQLIKIYDPRVVMFDMDGTLIGQESKDLSTEMVQLVADLKHEKRIIVIVSNTADAGLLARVASAIDADAACMPRRVYHRKPFANMLSQTLLKYNCPPAEAVLVGDKYYTDAVAGRAARLSAVLLLPRLR